MIEDDFEWSSEEEENETQLTIIEEEKIKILNKIEEYIELAKQTARLKMSVDYGTNLEIISRYVSALIDLDALEADPSVEEEKIFVKIKEIDSIVADQTRADIQQAIEEKYDGHKVKPTDDDNLNLDI